MCGRTCLTLEPNQIRCACKYMSTKAHPDKTSKSRETKEPQKEAEYTELKNDILLMPEWRAEYNCDRKYVPSYNIAPTDITPVLISADHFADDADDNEIQSRVLVPMMWGMIPFWHKGDYRKHGLTTNNCRLEHMRESKLYRGPFHRGQRCVVLCEGFYEWQTTKSAKPSERAAHLLYMPQEKGVQIYDKTTWTPDNVKLLKMAGLFDVWQDENGDKIYSYSVITFESSKIMSWLHHRMPAILETEKQVNDWLDFKRITDADALATLRPATQLKWHRVTNLVNNSRHKSDQCNKPIEVASPVVTPQNKSLLSWLNVRKRREEQTSQQLSDDENQTAMNIDIELEDQNLPKRSRFRDYRREVTSESKNIDSSEEKSQTCEDSSSKDCFPTMRMT